MGHGRVRCVRCLVEDDGWATALIPLTREERRQWLHATSRTEVECMIQDPLAGPPDGGDLLDLSIAITSGYAARTARRPLRVAFEGWAQWSAQQGFER